MGIFKYTKLGKRSETPCTHHLASIITSILPGIVFTKQYIRFYQVYVFAKIHAGEMATSRAPRDHRTRGDPGLRGTTGRTERRPAWDTPLNGEDFRLD